MDHETMIDTVENDRATLVRWAGGAAVAAAVLIGITQVGDLLTLNSDYDEALVVLNAVLKLVAACLLLLGLVGLFARQAEATGTLGLAGFLVAFLGTMLMAGDMWLEVLPCRTSRRSGPRRSRSSQPERCLAARSRPSHSSRPDGSCLALPHFERALRPVELPSS